MGPLGVSLGVSLSRSARRWNTAHSEVSAASARKLPTQLPTQTPTRNAHTNVLYPNTKLLQIAPPLPARNAHTNAHTKCPHEIHPPRNLTETHQKPSRNPPEVALKPSRHLLPPRNFRPSAGSTIVRNDFMYDFTGILLYLEISKIGNKDIILLRGCA